MHVLKRWVALPRGIRLVVGGAATVILIVAIAWTLIVPITDWLATHDVGPVTGAVRTLRLQTARDAARGRLLTLGAGLFAAGALWFTARSFTLSRHAFELTEQGQVTERYSKAIEQLGSEKLDVRVGGIYALERIARDSVTDHWAIMEVLSAFIREHSHVQSSSPEPEDSSSQKPQADVQADVQAAATVIGRRDYKRDPESEEIFLMLPDVNLTGTLLIRPNLAEAYLSGSSLSWAVVPYADLSGAYLTGANLTSANLTGADLAGARLEKANFTNAVLTGANLTGANLTGANLTDADLTGARLGKANLTDVVLTGTNLTGATRGRLDAPVPDGWVQDPDSGQLRRAGEDSGDAAN